MKKTFTRLFLLGFMLIGGQAFSQCVNCGSGSLGAYTASTNTTLAGGTYDYTSFTIDSGVTVTVTGIQPLVINATGNVDIHGTLDASGGNGTDGVTYVSAGTGGLGVAGGGNGGNGSFASGSGPIDGSTGTGPGSGGLGGQWSGGGGAGYATAGASASASNGIGGPAYGDPQLTPPNAGSGGGGGSGGYDCGAGGGGAGGGYIEISACGNLHIHSGGRIFVKGGNGGSDGTGNCGGGAGGSGGSVFLRSSQVTNDGLISAAGGIGGASQVAGTPYFGTGGDGAPGRLRLDGNLAGSGTTVPPSPFNAPITSITASIDTFANVSCFGASDGYASVQATGGIGQVTYLWSPSGSTTSAVSGLPPGCYMATITDSIGCTTMDSICITEPTAILVGTSSVPALCFASCDGSATATASGGSGSLFYGWLGTFSTSPTLTALCAGTYISVVTDSTGCSSTDTVEVLAPTAISTTETHTDASSGTSNDGTAAVVASGGTPGYTYLWTPGGMTTDSVSGLAPGTYTVVVTDSNGCMDTTVIEIGTAIGLQGGIAEIAMRAYPSPSSGVFQVAVTNTSLAGLSLELYGVAGQRLSTQALPQVIQAIVPFDLSTMPSGIYWLKLTGGQRVLSQSIMID